MNDERRPAQGQLNTAPEPVLISESPPPPEDDGHMDWSCPGCRLPLAKPYRDALYGAARKTLTAAFERRFEKLEAAHASKVSAVVETTVERTIAAVLKPPPAPKADTPRNVTTGRRRHPRLR